jgi:hypothetical protein
MLMKSKNTNKSQQFETFIGVDLGDRKHHVCVTDKKGVVLGEFVINNDRAALKQLCEDYLGLVPKRDQSGGTDKQLPISKTGNAYLRQLLVQCAQYLVGHFGPDCALRRQGLLLAAKGGRAAKKKAVIAIARKLAVMMVAMWQKGSDYEDFPPKRGNTKPASKPASKGARRKAA